MSTIRFSRSAAALLASLGSLASLGVSHAQPAANGVASTDPTAPAAVAASSESATAPPSTSVPAEPGPITTRPTDGAPDHAAPPDHPAPPITAPATIVLDAAAIDALIDERLAARAATAGWKDGFFIQTADAKTRLKIGGFTQFDGRFFVADTRDPHIDQFGFRSIRPDLQGTLFEHFDFRLMPDFANARLVLQDVYADVHYSDAVKLRVGKFKVPFGLERLQAETATLFVERGLPTQLAPNRDLGVQVFGELAHGVVAYQVGVFNGVADGQSGDGDVSDDKEAAIRVFLKPFAASTQRVLKDFGIGAAATYGDKTGTLASPDVGSYKTQGQTTFFAYTTGTTLMDTVVAGGKHWRATAQGDWYTGPLGVLAEYVRSNQEVALAGNHQDVRTDAWQVAGQWVITGDKASFKSVTPTRDFDPSKGQWGAFDVGARVGELRVIDTALFDNGYADRTKSARRAWSAGGGVNWYPNRNFRFVLDYERTVFRLGAKDGDRPTETSLVGRVQTVF